MPWDNSGKLPEDFRTLLINSERISENFLSTVSDCERLPKDFPGDAVKLPEDL